MGKHTISKDFSFCYGHRVWSQELHAELSEGSPCKCRHLHGHECRVVVHLTADSLNLGMVTDFTNLAWLKTFLDSTLDHKFIIDSDDPLYAKMIAHKVFVPLERVSIAGFTAGHSLKLPDEIVGPDREYLESFFIVDFVPTSENFSEWLFELVAVKMQPLGVEVEALEWWESPKSRAIYRNSKENIL